jgi:CRISPR-associated protein Cmr6
MNLGYFYYKGIYKNLSDEDLLDLISGDDEAIKRVNENKKSEFQGHLKKLNSSIEIKNDLENLHLEGYELIEFILTTKEPGLLIGTGYHHEIPKLKEQFINGFEFDYTTGLPIIPGSSIKGAIRDVFPLSESELKERVAKLDDDDEKFIFIELNEGRKEELKKFLNKSLNEEKILKLRNEIFENGDIFLDAELIDSEDIFKEEFFTPHKSKFENPVPLKFLVIRGGVRFKFRFLVKNGILNAKDKKELFKKIIIANGLGAKTNLNFGRFV